MASDEDTTNPPNGNGDDERFLTVNVRIGAEDEKMVRRAAVELDTSRSEFMAEAAIVRAREVLAIFPPLRAS